MPDIELNGKRISYRLKQSKRSRRVRLCVFCGGSLVVSAPQGINFKKIEEFILEKAEWVLEKMKIMEKRHYNPIFHKFSKNEYKKYKNQALNLVQNKIEEFNKIYGFSYNRISIRNSRSRWGSCSAKKNLNFSYKIIFLPEDLQNYIIIHELCHLREFNHSKRFWDLVKFTIPDCKEIKKEIKKI